MKRIAWIPTVTSTRIARTCANIESPKLGYIGQRNWQKPVVTLSLRRCKANKYNSSQSACKQIGFNILEAQHRHGNSLIVSSKFDFLPVYLRTVSRTLNSLFKVLFNCPSRYLFAIGLAVVFSLRGSLPPASDCNPKQSDSKDNHHWQSEATTNRPFTCYGQTTIKRSRVARLTSYNRLFRTPQLPDADKDNGIRLWAFPISLAVTFGIIVIFFFSA